MTTKDKAKLLRNKLSKLNDFKLKLNEDNLNDFETLRSEINNLLDANRRIRFSQITFYFELPDFSQINADDLPF